MRNPFRPDCGSTDVVDQVHLHALYRAGQGGPASKLGIAGLQLLEGHAEMAIGLARRHDLEEVSIEFLIHHEVAEAASGDHRDADIVWPRFDGRSDGLAELVGAPRRDLSRRVVGVDADRNDRIDLRGHHLVVDVAERVAHSLIRRQVARMGGVEAVVHQMIDDLQGAPGVDRVFLFLLGIPEVLVQAGIVLPLHDALGLVWQRIAAENLDGRHVVVVKTFLWSSPMTMTRSGLTASRRRMSSAIAL